MKVLVVGTGGSIVSGISTAADQTAATLERLGHEVDRMTAGERRRQRPNRINFENVTEVLRDAVSVWRRARTGRVKLVWIHAFGVPLLPAARALALVLGARFARRRAVVRFHAFGLEDFVRTGGWPLSLILKLLSAMSHRLVVEHEAAADSLRGATGSAKVAVLHNWVDVPDEPAPLPSSPPLRVVFVGGLIRRKGVYELAEAMRLLDDLPVVLRLVGGAGEDGPDAWGALQAATQDLSDAGRIEFAGELAPDVVRSELRAAHVYVLPSKAEGMPLSMLEAMAEGRAVLVSSAGNMEQIVSETGCGTALESVEPAAIAEALRLGCDDPNRWRTQGANAHQAALERYSTEAALRQLAVVLDRAVPTAR